MKNREYISVDKQSLQRILQNVKQINDGNLDIVFQSDNESNLNGLERSLEEWASNYQELILHFTSTVNAIGDDLDKIKADNSDLILSLKDRLAAIYNDLIQIKLYNVEHRNRITTGGKQDAEMLRIGD